MNLLSKRSKGIEVTYDIYCYKSNLFAPDLNEAQKVTLMRDQENNSNANSNIVKIISSLRELNPKLDSSFMTGYNNLNTNKNTNEKQIILNTPKGDFATQITILNNCVLFSIPYWYSDKVANDVLRQTDEYLKILRHAVCYYVYDPQAQKAYDPWNEAFDALPFYTKVYKTIEQNTSEKARHKLWWKL